MKRFSAISLMMTIVVVKASACIGSYTHNYYMMNLYPKFQWEQRNEDRYQKFWRTYTNDEVWGYSDWQKEQILMIAQKKNDSELVGYVNLLSDYLDNCGEISNGWDYPTAEELNRHDETMERILDTARRYTGTRLRPQYALMQMRALMQMERHQDNISFWQTTASKLPESVYRDMMRNIYAGALLRTGQRAAAWDIYAEQGDYESLRWSVFKYRNLEGIRKIYADSPDAPVLAYLVQDFVTSAQETYDNIRGFKEGFPEMSWTDAEVTEWINDNVNMVGCNPTYDAEVNAFISFAHQVVGEKKNSQPALWMAAAALLHYFQGANDAAMSEADEAQRLDGSQRVKDNARAIRLLIATTAMKQDKKFSQYVVKELQWLDAKIAEEGEYDEYFTHAKDRIVNIGLAGRFEREGNKSMSAAVWGLDVNSYKRSSDGDGDDGWNNNYNSEFYANSLHRMTADEVKAFHDFVKAPHKDVLEQYVAEQNAKVRSEEYFNDLIGTKLLAEGRFADAVPYLEKVSLPFMERQNISWYLAHRDYTKPFWFVRQPPTDVDAEVMDGPNKAIVTVNKKLLFCREMQQLMARHLLAPAGDQRKQLAYQLAVRYYQASAWGDCWFLSDYGKSSYHPEDEPLPAFVESALNYLTEGLTADDAQLRLECFFARAFIPAGELLVYDWQSGDWQMDTTTRQYKALTELVDYVRKNPSARSVDYVMECDRIQRFL